MPGPKKKTQAQQSTRPANTSTPHVRLKRVSPSGKEEPGFFEQVYQLVRQIPAGRVTTYGAIAKALGSGLSARMVGWAMNGSHSGSDPVPAHRVVNRNGQLSGKIHFGSPTRMQEQLEAEGIKVKDDTVQQFDKHFWNPAAEW